MADEATGESTEATETTTAAVETAVETPKTFTQAEVDEIVAKRVNASKAQFKAFVSPSDHAALAKAKSEAESALHDMTASFETAKADAIKLKVGIDAGLPTDLVARLQGVTEEELRADAEKLAQFIPKSKSMNAGTTKPVQSPNDQLRQMLLNGGR